MPCVYARVCVCASICYTSDADNDVVAATPPITDVCLPFASTRSTH